MRRDVAAVFALLTSPISAILVAPDSPCAVRCGNVLQSTSTTDLSCSDSAFSSQPGQTFKDCVECEMNSTFVNSAGLSDLSAMLYNLRYTASYCIFNDSKVASTPCVTGFACGHFLTALDHNDLALPTGPIDYSYCNDWNDDNLFKCQNCLEPLGEELYLVNYMTALSASCQQKPKDGKRLGIDGSVFSPTPVNITDPLASSNAIASTFSPASGPLTLGAKIGIAVGCILVFLILLGCFIVRRGKRRRRAVLAAYAQHPGGMEQVPKWKEPTNDSPQSMSSNAFMTKPSNYQWQRGGADESPASVTSAGQYFSPYTSQHASPVSPGQRGAAAEWGNVPIPKPYRRESIGQGVGEQIEMSPLAEAERERWEREAGQVGFVPAPAPTIRHPGVGRDGYAI